MFGAILRGEVAEPGDRAGFATPWQAGHVIAPDPGPSTSIERLVATRSAWHALAEHVLAPDLHRRTGRIGLRRTPGGFGQPGHVVDGIRRRVRVDGSYLVIDGDSAGESWNPISTIRDACQVVGLPVGARTSAYEPSSTLEPDAPLVIEASASDELAAWFRLVEDAVEVFRRRHAGRHPSIAQLWPEHFDLACSVGEVNYGGSPGDAGGVGRSEPNLYVGPWKPPSVGGFWNEPYGAAVSRSEVMSVDDAVAFFESGSVEADRIRTATREN